MSEITEPITTTLVQPDTITTTLSVGQGPSGPAGATGPTGATGATGPAGSNATATTDASLLVSGTLADARLSSNVALENVANTFTAKQSFSGTDHAGLCLNSLTTAEYNALTAANGDLFRDSTTDRIDARLARGTVELIDSAGGQVIGGNLAATTLMVGGASGPLFRNNAGTIEARNAANSANAPLGCSNLFASSAIQSTSEISARGGSSSIALYNGASRTGAWVDGGTSPRLIMTSGGHFGLSSSTTDTSASDTSLSRNAAGVWQIGTTANNALGSLLLTNLTASGNGTFGSGTSFSLNVGQDAGRGAFLTGTVSGTTFGLSFPSANIIFPCSGTTQVTNTISLGRADYQFLNVFSQNMTLSGLLDLRKTATANILQFSTNTSLRTDTSQLSIFDTGLGRNNISLWRGGNFVVGSSALIAACSNLDSTGGSVDTSLSRNAAGVWQMGTTANNALGSLLLTNLTASGTVTIGTYTVGTLPSAAANTRARAFVTDSNLAFNSTNLGSTVTAGGSTLVPVFSNGTNWVIG